MILVTLGTQDKDFSRLLKAIDREIENKNIKEKVIVQAGYTKYESKNMEMFDLIDSDELDKLVKDCSLLITHGGVGSILNGIQNNKKIIAASRLKKYKEHTNDHQKQIVKEFSDRGYLLELRDFNKLDKLLDKAKTFKPTKFKSNNSNFIKKIDKYIEEDNNISWYNKFRTLSCYGYTGIFLNLINVLIFSILYSKYNLNTNIYISFFITLFINIILNIINRIPIMKDLFLFIFNKAITLILTINLMHMFCKMLKFNAIYSMFFVAIITMIINWIIIKFIFRKKEI